MLEHLGVSALRLLTNNPAKVASLKAMGFDVPEIVPIQTGSNPHNEGYLSVKVAKMGHLLK